MLVGQSVQRDRSLPTGTFKETLDGIVPPELVILLQATICRLEVGVTTLEAKKTGARYPPETFGQRSARVGLRTLVHVTARHFISLMPLIFSSICSFVTRMLK